MGCLATEDSWTHEFVGNAARLLEAHIKQYSGIDDKKIYAPYCAIVQSSGTGKSKTVDEYSKIHFVISVNLRDPDAGGMDDVAHLSLR